MKFTKMQGIGNDYVYVNCFEEDIADPAQIAVRVSDRHFGVGSDGLILIKPSEIADFRMEMYNADGSLGAMCGNGIRCVAKYVYDHGMTDQTQIRIETGSGIKTLDLTVEGGKVSLVCVDMGAPILEPERIPVRAVNVDTGVQTNIRSIVDTETETPSADDDAQTEILTPGADRTNSQPIISCPIQVGAETYSMTCVSMGNPHCIVPVDDVDALAIETIGPLFENHPLFPDRMNTEFIRVIDRSTVQMRVWERGSGETLACGTGACATAVACCLNGWTDDTVTVKLRGGDLKIQWDRQRNTVYMTGPAETVFEGQIDF